MADNVNITVQDTINDIVVNAAVVVETIDINVQAAVDEVQIIANPNNYVVNINRIIGEQVQSDWTQTDDQAPDYIKNKPSIPTLTSDLTNDGEDGINPFITAADVTPQVNSDWDATSGVAEILNKPILAAVATSGNYEDLSNVPKNTSDFVNDGADGNNPFITAADVPASVTSVGLTMPSAFSVVNSPITSSGTLAVTGAGLVSQYIRGDGTLANFPNSIGGGSSVNYYLNGSVSQGTFGGDVYYQLSKTPVFGAGTNFTRTQGQGNGYIASFITNAGDPNLLNIPAGNWALEFYFSASANGSNPRFYGELYKVSASNVFTLIASESVNPEFITNGTDVDQYFTSISVPQTTLLITDRIAIRVYVIPNARNITLHTENSNLSEVITTFSTGLTALNGLTTQVQSFATGTSGTDFGISSATSTHTFNLPTASAANRGALSSTDWTTFNGKFTLPALTSGSVLFSNGTTIAQDNANFFWDNTNKRLGIGTNAPTSTIDAVGNEFRFAALSGAINFYNTPGVNQHFNFLNLRQDSDYIFKQNRGGAVNTTSLLIKGNTGNVLINTTTDAGFRLDVNGTARVQSTLKIGAATALNASSVLDLESTTRGFLPPRMTTTQKNAIATPAAGLVVYDTTLGKLCVRTASTWETITSV